MYIPDGTEYDYGNRSEEGLERIKDGWIRDANEYLYMRQVPGRYSWGWLGDTVPQNHQGWTDLSLKQKVLDHLKSMTYKDCVMHHCGTHSCEICPGGSEAGFNGSLIIDYQGKQYRAPDPQAVAHYIEVHNYNPGEEVIEMLFAGRQWTYEDERKLVENERNKRHSEIIKQRRQEYLNKSPAERAAIKRSQAYAAKMQAIGRSKLEQLRRDGALIDESL